MFKSLRPHEACKASLSLGFSRQEYWRELPFLPPGSLPDPGLSYISYIIYIYIILDIYIYILYYLIYILSYIYRIKPISLTPPALADGFFTPEPPANPQHAYALCTYTGSLFSDHIFLLELLKSMFCIIPWLWQSLRTNAVKAKRKEQQQKVNANNKILNQNYNERWSQDDLEHDWI